MILLPRRLKGTERHEFFRRRLTQMDADTRPFGFAQGRLCAGTSLHGLTLFIKDLDSCLRRNDIRVEIAALG